MWPYGLEPLPYSGSMWRAGPIRESLVKQRTAAAAPAAARGPPVLLPNRSLPLASAFTSLNWSRRAYVGFGWFLCISSLA